MNFNELNKDNFLLFAVKYYENPHASTQDEFEEDMKRFKYIKRWLKKYHETGTINSHLLLNHIMVIFNCWNDAAVPMMFFKIESQYWPYLKSFCSYLERLPEYPHTTLHDVEEDTNIIKILNGIN